MKRLLSNSAFYDNIAASYDEMISFNNVVHKRKLLLKNFISHSTKTAADIGCGSGVDSIALSLLGLKVSAFDPSSEMLKTAELNSNKMNAEVDFYNSAAHENT